ncbi:GTPase Era [Metallosphaera sp. J1]|uniref:GTPase n=1 Tax=Metallosphaera TaxID=41980 RepID=UPI001EDD0420|nr:GTPase [Metallosphaera javensis (ex Hofmann et al. 2022)]MCG3108689.1 GTPase Era [Metallosphaera javensis (ex Hofmann et al. 2022)]BCS91623.1 MAG: GTP-binding protein [Metallosphaera javensis (ex Sakai et al. 2022)]
MLKVLKSVISRSDVVMEVLDSREPELTRSRRVEDMILKSGKELLLVINKADLVPLEILKEWKEYFEERGLRSVFVSSREHQGTRILRNSVKELLRGKEGIVGVVGYPKTGKSSVINALKGKHAASTSSIPMSTGYTKSLQLVRIDSRIYAIDSPGVIPPDGDPFERVLRGSRPEDLEDPVKVAIRLVERIVKFNPNSLTLAYRIEFSSPLDFLEKLALKRGWIYKSDREPNIDQASVQLIRDYHEGKITYYTKPPGLKHDKTSDI